MNRLNNEKHLGEFKERFIMGVYRAGIFLYTLKNCFNPWPTLILWSNVVGILLKLKQKSKIYYIVQDQFNWGFLQYMHRKIYIHWRVYGTQWEHVILYSIFYDFQYAIVKYVIWTMFFMLFSMLQCHIA
jgi:hypothetical protein